MILSDASAVEEVEDNDDDDADLLRALELSVHEYNHQQQQILDQVVSDRKHKEQQQKQQQQLDASNQSWVSMLTTSAETQSSVRKLSSLKKQSFHHERSHLHTHANVTQSITTRTLSQKAIPASMTAHFQPPALKLASTATTSVVKPPLAPPISTLNPQLQPLFSHRKTQPRFTTIRKSNFDSPSTIHENNNDDVDLMDCELSNEAEFLENLQTRQKHKQQQQHSTVTTAKIFVPETQTTPRSTIAATIARVKQQQALAPSRPFSSTASTPTRTPQQRQLQWHPGRTGDKVISVTPASLLSCGGSHEIFGRTIVMRQDSDGANERDCYWDASIRAVVDVSPKQQLRQEKP
ncbi:hypothetical protein HK100_004680 [Physocladia obscura]|uniref:Uncharacterized protein n=1 Tax=Physocladia obscura TaxID=109957 RepID=A0AAD5TC36_9FUNG|nr:hypothetical protein HK100_004680 [Physocladia obscura]